MEDLGTWQRCWIIESLSLEWKLITKVVATKGMWWKVAHSGTQGDHYLLNQS